MATVKALVHVLGDGIGNAMHAAAIEEQLNMDSGHTQEPTRDLIRDAITNHNIPIGSLPRNGYFLISTEIELNKVLSSLEQRIVGLQNRIQSLRDGWQQRCSSRAQGGNWPK
jgi:hypothetical protein